MDDDHDTPGSRESQTQGHRGGSAPWFVWAFVLVVVIYPLSFGPASWLQAKVPSIRPAVQTIYMPIYIACDHSQPLLEAVIWYLRNVWRVPVVTQ